MYVPMYVGIGKGLPLPRDVSGWKKKMTAFTYNIRYPKGESGAWGIIIRSSWNTANICKYV